MTLMRQLEALIDSISYFETVSILLDPDRRRSDPCGGWLLPFNPCPHETRHQRAQQVLDSLCPDLLVAAAVTPSLLTPRPVSTHHCRSLSALLAAVSLMAGAHLETTAAVGDQSHGPAYPPAAVVSLSTDLVRG